METNQKTFQNETDLETISNKPEEEIDIVSLNENTQKNWKNIKCKGKRPTLEEILSFALQDSNNKK